MDIEWLIYHLIHNDDENFTSIFDLDIDICISNEDQWHRLLMGLSRNKTITSIHLVRGFDRVADDDDLRRLYSAMRKVPRLYEVKLEGFSLSDLEQTKSLFENNEIIEAVWIENAELSEESWNDRADRDDFARLGRFIGHLASASMHRLSRLRIELPSQYSHRVNLAPLLSRSSKLEYLVVETTSQIFSSFRPDDKLKHFATTMVALQTNTRLKTLEFDYQMWFDDFIDVAAMLQQNKTLTDLCVRLERPPTSDYANLITHDCDNDYPTCFIESMQLFFKALKTNTDSALKNFESRPPSTALFETHYWKPPAKRTGDAKIIQDLMELAFEMLECNLSLESVSLFLFDLHNYCVVKEKQMFLRLNKRGRKSVHHPSIRETVSKSDLVTQLSKHSIDDLDGLYYYISNNPSICRPLDKDENKQKMNIKKQVGTEDHLGGINGPLSTSRHDKSVSVNHDVPQKKRQCVASLP